MTQKELETRLIELWGSTVKPFNVDRSKRLTVHISYEDLSNDSFIYMLDLLLKSSGSSGSGFSVDMDNYDILDYMGNKIYKVRYISRKLEPIRRCYDMFGRRGTGASEGEWSLAVMYMIAELENYTKQNNRYIDQKGFLKRKLPKVLNKHNKHIVGQRVNQIGDLLKIYLYRNNSSFAMYLKGFDARMIKYVNKLLKDNDCHNIENGVKIPAKYEHCNIIKRINNTRHSVMHGEKQAGWDMFFYLTLQSIMFLYDEEMYQEINT